MQLVRPLSAPLRSVVLLFPMNLHRVICGISWIIIMDTNTASRSAPSLPLCKSPIDLGNDGNTKRITLEMM
jgi:hypothetical protein